MSGHYEVRKIAPWHSLPWGIVNVTTGAALSLPTAVATHAGLIDTTVTFWRLKRDAQAALDAYLAELDS